jgi:tetratricopeptide (TPR) repeat protein
MINAEYLLAKDPDHLPYAEAMLKAAVSGVYQQTALWIARLIFEANNSSDKPSLATYLLLKDSYRDLGFFDKAVAACQKALELKRNDGALADELRNLSAQMTVARGKYGEDGDFRKSIRDKDYQDQLHASEHLVKSVDYRARAVEEAKRAYINNPDIPTIIFNYADALIGLDTPEAFADALKVLDDAFTKSKDFAYRRRSGEMRIRHIKAQVRQAKKALQDAPEDETLKEELARLSALHDETALAHYRQCVENYPTDLKVKYEYGQSLIKVKNYDDAIPLFQEAQRDPRFRIAAMDKTGLCFFLKGWHTDAIDVFEQAYDACEVKDNSTAKDIRYNLARSCEADGQTEKALELYRKLAQLDFGYRDVRDRVGKLRNMGDS